MQRTASRGGCAGDPRGTAGRGIRAPNPVPGATRSLRPLAARSRPVNLPIALVTFALFSFSCFCIYKTTQTSKRRGLLPLSLAPPGLRDCRNAGGAGSASWRRQPELALGGPRPILPEAAPKLGSAAAQARALTDLAPGTRRSEKDVTDRLQRWPSAWTSAMDRRPAFRSDT
ncbi:hypothetical protein P7K49_006873 [Saguinus oedipus]|uniref:Uncharacterized protein n=1 Tax=Saguinus oedipus TaxID=9490 RepID=A0ABQ9W3L8_SAGOE|nr:hypothetical protein P7K49_006873 [Saguinus oedipus]